MLVWGLFRLGLGLFRVGLGLLKVFVRICFKVGLGFI